MFWILIPEVDGLDGQKDRIVEKMAEVESASEKNKDEDDDLDALLDSKCICR